MVRLIGALESAIGCVCSLREEGDARQAPVILSCVHISEVELAAAAVATDCEAESVAVVGRKLGGFEQVVVGVVLPHVNALVRYHLAEGGGLGGHSGSLEVHEVGVGVSELSYRYFYLRSGGGEVVLH